MMGCCPKCGNPAAEWVIGNYYNCKPCDAVASVKVKLIDPGGPKEIFKGGLDSHWAAGEDEAPVLAVYGRDYPNKSAAILAHIQKNLDAGNAQYVGTSNPGPSPDGSLVSYRVEIENAGTQPGPKGFVLVTKGRVLAVYQEP